MADHKVTIPETSLWANRKCLVICCIVSIANMQYGLDSAAVGGLQAMPGFLAVFGYENPSAPGGYAIAPTFQQLIASLLTLGSFLSCLVAGAFAHYMGRKPALWLACGMNAVACIIQIATVNKGAIYVGRLILGFANGFLVSFSNIYTSEASPAHLRGVIVALFAYWVTIGSIVGAAITNSTQRLLTKASYQIPIGTLFIVPLFLSIGLFFVPESPRYLLHKNRPAAAKRALETLRSGSVAQDFIELEWAEMVKSISEQEKLASSVGAVDMFRGTDLRRTLLCFGMIACQAASGSWFFIAYSTYFLIVSGLSVDEAFKFSVMQSCFGFIGVNIGMVAMRFWCGRRVICMVGATICGFCMLAVAVSGTVAEGTVGARNCLVAFSSLFMCAYYACVGAASYPIATEVVNTRLRSWTVGTATAIGYLLAWLTSFCSPYFINTANLNWGSQYGYIWAGSNFACVIFFFFFIPEMKGRTLEEIDEMFMHRVGARKFHAYVSTIHDEAMMDIKLNTGVFDEKDMGETRVEEVKREF
ncbi:hypothetical protein KVT40_008985 [Elsinoe batatas]|uniref:Major facilitator superfamily (MFS) profile domain-containing protein n=1 Tax=Elsinoe batatas TaxID=2601811 RepID=A0A8K0KWE7_9PEZI|nr:hypothetical protein KVT40_008985 [Elsinoe batatas]